MIQCQDSLQDQLRDLVSIANRNGMYDAADFIDKIRYSNYDKVDFDMAVKFKNVRDMLFRAENEALAVAAELVEATALNITLKKENEELKCS